MTLTSRAIQVAPSVKVFMGMESLTVSDFVAADRVVPLYLDRYPKLADAPGGSSSGPDTTLYIPLVILHTKYTGRRQNDFNVYA